MRNVRVLVFICAFALAAGSCGSSDEVTSPPATDPTSATETTALSATTGEAPNIEADNAPDASEVPDEPDREDDSQTEDLEPGTATAESTATATSTHPDIIAARATREDSGTWRFDVTVSSPYDTPERYADAWRVLGPDGAELGVRILTHDHANEQPFTRSQGGIDIADDVSTVTIEGRDLVNGWGGGTLELELPVG